MLKLIRPIVKPFLRPVVKAFKASLRQPEKAQRRLLQTIIGNLAATEYGESLQIKTGDGIDEFRGKAPLVTYDDLSAWIERQKQFEGRALVRERVIFYEPTSGSSAAAKFIPYTKSLRNSFNRMFLVWLDDLLANGPPLSYGKTFISISPAFHRQSLTGQGVKVGLEDDAQYLSHGARSVIKPFFVLPASVKRLQEPSEFKRAVATLLVAEEHLEIISVWNPSFLEIILDFIKANREQLITDLRRGRMVCESLEYTFKPLSKKRLARFAESSEDQSIDWPHIWPDLKIISCWTSAQAEAAAERVRRRFPNVFLQGKGLLATEAPLTLPLVAAGGFVPLPAEVFYEFLDERGGVSLLHELDNGREYEIVVTQQGGLYRYRLGDRVRVTGFYEAVPCLEYVGRSDAVCDLVGEKLNERFVQACLARLCAPGDFQMLIPVPGTRPRYVLLIDKPDIDRGRLEAELEALFNEAYHYRQARLLGQLGPVGVLPLPEARAVYYDHFVSRGMKLGDIKHRFLLTNPAEANLLMQRLATKEVLKTGF